jgi:hypothetical protein
MANLTLKLQQLNSTQHQPLFNSNKLKELQQKAHTASVIYVKKWTGARPICGKQSTRFHGEVIRNMYPE